MSGTLTHRDGLCLHMRHMMQFGVGSGRMLYLHDIKP
jgi:hypothetical protein